MSADKSTRLFSILILALVVGGVFLFLNQLGVIKVPSPKYAFLTPKEISELNWYNENKRAELLYKKKGFVEKEDNTAIYYFFPKGNGHIFFIKDDPSIGYIIIKDEKYYNSLLTEFEEFEKLETNDSDTLYKVDSSAIFFKGYSRTDTAYVIVIDRITS